MGWTLPLWDGLRAQFKEGQRIIDMELRESARAKRKASTKWRRKERAK